MTQSRDSSESRDNLRKSIENSLQTHVIAPAEQKARKNDTAPSSYSYKPPLNGKTRFLIDKMHILLEAPFYASLSGQPDSETWS